MEGTMAAAVYQGQRTLTVEQLALPEVGPDDVLIEVSHCGICGSDLHFVMEDWARPGWTGGHEYSGVITAIGPEVTGWAVGDRVVGGPGTGCGECRYCRDGRVNLCAQRGQVGVTPHQGAFARFKAENARSLFRIPEGLDIRVAALTEPVAVALRGVLRPALVEGQRALVTGAGPIGLLTVAVLRAFGIEDVTVSEPSPARRDRARAVGATEVVTPDALVAPAMPMDTVDAPFDAAFECSGRADAMEAALSQLARGGMLVLSGTGMARPRFDNNRIILNELVITGTMEYTRRDYDASLALLADGRLPVELLIEPDDVPLSGMQQAMERLVSGELPGKVMVVPGA